MVGMSGRMRAYIANWSNPTSCRSQCLARYPEKVHIYFGMRPETTHQSSASLLIHVSTPVHLPGFSPNSNSRNLGRQRQAKNASVPISVGPERLLPAAAPGPLFVSPPPWTVMLGSKARESQARRPHEKLVVGGSEENVRPAGH